MVSHIRANKDCGRKLLRWSWFNGQLKTPKWSKGHQVLFYKLTSNVLEQDFHEAEEPDGKWSFWFSWKAGEHQDRSMAKLSWTGSSSNLQCLHIREQLQKPTVWKRWSRNSKPIDAFVTKLCFNQRVKKRKKKQTKEVMVEGRLRTSAPNWTNSITWKCTPRQGVKLFGECYPQFFLGYS